LLPPFFIILAGANPFAAYYNFIIVPLSSKFSALEVLVKATPLIFTGIAVTFASPLVITISARKVSCTPVQSPAAWVGATFTKLPAIAAVPLMLVLGFAARDVVALLPAFLKVKLKVDEVVTTY